MLIMQNGMRAEMEYLKWKNAFRLEYGHEKLHQNLEPKTNATVEVS